MTNSEALTSWYQQLDKLRQTMENAAEEYGQALDEFEEQFGIDAREQYEENHA